MLKWDRISTETPNSVRQAANISLSGLFFASLLSRKRKSKKANMISLASSNKRIVVWDDSKNQLYLVLLSLLLGPLVLAQWGPLAVLHRPPVSGENTEVTISVDHVEEHKNISLASCECVDILWRKLQDPGNYHHRDSKVGPCHWRGPNSRLHQTWFRSCSQSTGGPWRGPGFSQLYDCTCLCSDSGSGPEKGC